MNNRDNATKITNVDTIAFDNITLCAIDLFVERNYNLLQ